VIINYGKTDFAQDSTAGFILGYDYSATKAKFEIGSSATKLFKYDGTDISLTGGTITGGTIQTAASGQRIIMDSSLLRMYNASNIVIWSLGSDLATTIQYIEPTTDIPGIEIFSSVEHTTKPLLWLSTQSVSATYAAQLIETYGLGYGLDVKPNSNASRVKAGAIFRAVSGQGANINLLPISTVPQTPSEGDIYTDSDDHLPYYYNGSAWVAMSDTTQYAAGVIADLIETDEAENPVTVTIGFQPTYIKLHYFIQGHTVAATNYYVGKKGVAIYSGTTLVFNDLQWGEQTDVSAPNRLNGDNKGPYFGDTSTNGLSNISPTPNGTTDPISVGTAIDDNLAIKIAIGITSTSSTGFVIYRTTSGPANPLATTQARAKIAYEAWK